MSVVFTTKSYDSITFLFTNGDDVNDGYNYIHKPELPETLHWFIPDSFEYAFKRGENKGLHTLTFTESLTLPTEMLKDIHILNVVVSDDEDYIQMVDKSLITTPEGYRNADEIKRKFFE